MTIDEKATELGRLIGQSTEYQAVKRANDALNEDREASGALRRMEQLRQDAQQMLERGEQPTDEMERDLDQLLAKVQGNAVYIRAAVAQENFEKLMLIVNEWIL